MCFLVRYQKVINGVIDKVGAHCKDNVWTVKQSKNVAKFMKNLPGEMMVQTWNQITSCQNIKNIQAMHKLVGAEIVAQVNASRNLG
jgi:hypothetical protein